MAERYNIKSSQIADHIYLLIDETDTSNWKDGGRMLVDSDQLSFIYIMETENELIYIGIPKEYWSDLKSALQKGNSVILRTGESELELSAIHEELAYLIENIKGNANYGKEMVEAVEEVF